MNTMQRALIILLTAALASSSAIAASPSPAASPRASSSASAAPSPVPDPSPSPAASGGPREPVLTRIDRLGLGKKVLDDLAASDLPLASPTGPLTGEQRRSVLFDWRTIVDRRQRIAQLDVETAQLTARRETEKLSAKNPPLEAPAPAELDRRREELAQMRVGFDRDTKALAALALEREAAAQAVNAVRARPRTGPVSHPASAKTTMEELASLLAHPFGLPIATQQTLELEEAARQRRLKATDDLIDVLAASLDAQGSARPVSAAEVTVSEQRQQEAAKEVAKEQSQAEATIRRAEKDKELAEKTRRDAEAQSAAATSSEERDLAAARKRLADREQSAAEALKSLGQLKADAGATHLARTEKEVVLYRYLLRLATEPPSSVEVASKLREVRAEVKALQGREQSLAARLQQVKDEQIGLGTARATAEKNSKVKGRLAEPAARESRVIEGHRATLDDQAVTITKMIEDLRGTLDSARKLQLQLEQLSGDEGLLARRRPELSLAPLGEAFSDLDYLRRFPERSFRPVTEFVTGVWRALTGPAAGAVALPMALSLLFGLAIAAYGHRYLRHLARRAAELQGPATGTAISLAAVAVLWAPLLLPTAAGALLIPSQERGFVILAIWLHTWFIAHLVLRMAKKWFLVPQVPEGTPPLEKAPPAEWVDVVMPPLPPGDLATQERVTCDALYRTLLPLAALTCTLLPTYLTMRAVLYRPELARQVWLVYELGLVALLFRAVRLRAEQVQIRRHSGTLRQTSVQVVGSLRAIVLVSCFAVPIVEVFGFGSLARFLVSRAGLTVLIAHVVRMIYEAVLELWRKPPEVEVGDPDEADDRQAHETLGELIGSMLSLLLISGTVFVLFWIWGGTWGAWDAVVRIASRNANVMGIELSVANFVLAGLSLWLARWVAGVMDWFLERRVYPRTDFDSGLRYAVSQTAHYVIFCVGCFFALDAVGVGLEGVKWFAGFAGIGIGIGMQNIVQNFVSGLIVLYERPVRVGDVVDVKGVFGIIKRISVRATLVRQTSNIDVFVPNSVLLSESLVNWTLRGQRVRLEIPIIVDGDTDPEHARAVMLRCAAEEVAVLKRPAPAVLLDKVTATSSELALLVWVKTPLRVREIKSNLLFAVMRELRHEGVSASHHEAVAQAPAAPDSRHPGTPSAPLGPSKA